MNMTRYFRLFAPCPTKNPWIWAFTVLLLALAVSVLAAADVYFNDFNGPVGTTYPEWTPPDTQIPRIGSVPSRQARTASGCDRGITQRQAAIPGRIRGTAIVKAPPYVHNISCAWRRRSR
jgi:hypothetical protein